MVLGFTNGGMLSNRQKEVKEKEACWHSKQLPQDNPSLNSFWDDRITPETEAASVELINPSKPGELAKWPGPGY